MQDRLTDAINLMEGIDQSSIELNGDDSPSALVHLTLTEGGEITPELYQ